MGDIDILKGHLVPHEIYHPPHITHDTSHFARPIPTPCHTSATQTHPPVALCGLLQTETYNFRSHMSYIRHIYDISHTWYMWYLYPGVQSSTPPRFHWCILAKRKRTILLHHLNFIDFLDFFADFFVSGPCGYLSHVTHMNELCHTHEWVMSHTWMSYITHMNESCHTYKLVMSHTWMSYITHMNDLCHTYEWVISHTWMSYVAHINESCHT